jgi:hypothetical protein
MEMTPSVNSGARIREENLEHSLSEVCSDDTQDERLTCTYWNLQGLDEDDSKISVHLSIMRIERSDTGQARGLTSNQQTLRKSNWDCRWDVRVVA